MYLAQCISGKVLIIISIVMIILGIGLMYKFPRMLKKGIGKVSFYQEITHLIHENIRNLRKFLQFFYKSKRKL